MSSVGRVSEPTQPDPDQVRLQQSERQLARSRADARALAAQNDRLNQTLREARTRLLALKDELDALSRPPLSRALVVGEVLRQPDRPAMVDVAASGRRVRVAVAADLSADGLLVGDEVLLNDAQVLVARGAAVPSGDLATVTELHPDDHAVVVRTASDAEVRLVLSARLRDEPPDLGDSLLVDVGAGLALRPVERARVADLVLDEVPDVDYDDIGGLSHQIEQIRDAVELPFRHRDLYLRYGLSAPKGILLYGPPGCGKTMIAKAVATSLGPEGSHFLSIKGPELLNKYVGETERQIRMIFARARELAADGRPVIVFFDEMDSLFRTRGTGISSDIENTIVAQLLSEIDGVEGLDNVIIIGASNREDMIDPAILRPGRLDQKIKLDRPDADGARQIFGKYLTLDTPLHPDAVAAAGGDRSAAVAMLIDGAVSGVFAASDENRFLEVTYAGGDRDVLYFADFASGAMIRNIVDRAKKLAIKAELAGTEGGVSVEGIHRACRDEFTENEDLPNTTNPDDWARISGRKGERIAFIRTLTGPSGASRAVPLGDLALGD